MNITCPNNSVIVFDDANFGRGRSDSPRCKQFWGLESIPCDNHEQTLKVLDNKCHEKQQCILPVDKAIFGNPCSGVTKYLYVNYHCKRKGNHDSITTAILTKHYDKQPTINPFILTTEGFRHYPTKEYVKKETKEIKASMDTIIVVSALVSISIAALVTITVLCYQRQRSKHSLTRQVRQDQIITEKLIRRTIPR
ncbi:unnamed protein product [Mytilus edulis]|uniref:SUEL-type lectin domain-containing protein n=1 Tax=Mytilus edulis TaxID=6550 RepID=A0A8S3RXM5_MYTED|nr:unnamed protein product [Mytilus edulis]